MKKLFILCLICCFFSPVYAQRGFGRGVTHGKKPAARHYTLRKKVHRTTTRSAARSAVQLSKLPPQHQLVPLKIADTKTAIPTMLAVPQALTRPELAVGTLLRNTYLQYQEADATLDRYLAQVKPESAEFLYRGLHVADVGDIAPLFNGLQVDKTGYNSIYMTSNHAVARHYAKLEEGIPVVISMGKSMMGNSSLRPANIGNFYAEKDVPAEAIRDIFVLLDVNGTPAWHRVLWQNKLVFVPLTEKAPAAQTQHIKITNLPGEPLVKLGGTVDDAPTILSARMLVGADSWHFIRPTDAIGRYTEQTFLPKDILENKESFYRGMRLGKLDDIKNLLINGLEVNKSNYSGEIYASLQISIPLYYATMGSENLPVLIQIPATETLRSYAPEAFPTEDRYAAKAFQTGEVCIFRRDIPAHFISNVWVFLEVNGKPDWYRVTLEDDALVFTPCGKMIKGSN